MSITRNLQRTGLRHMLAILMLLACCQCTGPQVVYHPQSAKALVYNAIAIYEQDGLLQDNFYTDDNLKRVSGAATVVRAPSDNSAGADWGERIFTGDFVDMEAPTAVWRPDLNIPPVRFEPSRQVEDGKIIAAHLFLVFQAEFVGVRRSVIAPLLGRRCREDERQESAKSTAITMEPFNAPLGHTQPIILSCTGARKNMTLDFGLAEPDGDPLLQTLLIVETEK